jgi:hypothetical protein
LSLTFELLPLFYVGRFYLATRTYVRNVTTAGCYLGGRELA